MKLLKVAIIICNTEAYMCRKRRYFIKIGPKYIHEQFLKKLKIKFNHQVLNKMLICDRDKFLKNSPHTNIFW